MSVTYTRLMLNIISRLLDLLAPPPEEVLLLRQETKDSFRQVLKPEKHSTTVALASYQNQRVKSAITANKFYNYRPASHLLSSLIEEWLNDQPSKTTYLVPIPLGKVRQKKRGYNQVTRVLTDLEKDNIILLPILERIKDTPPQTSLKRTERLKNLAGAFVVKTPIIIKPNARLILVDDVITTGATLSLAYACLKPHLPDDCEFISLAFAH